VDVLVRALGETARLLLSGDPEVLQVTMLSLQISLTATVLSLLIGIPLGTWLGLASFPGRRVLLGLVNTGMGAPPVVVGLLIAVFLWRSGPLGHFRLLYTPTAMIAAQFVLALPIIVGLTAAAMQQMNPKLHLQILALGANRWQLLWLLVREARLPVLAAAMAGFGALISEVGAAMMVGGNIAGQTRVLTTATVLEASKGNFALALAFGFLLLLVMFAVNFALTSLQQRQRPP
jgi:tungstate transport system permease protein